MNVTDYCEMSLNLRGFSLVAVYLSGNYDNYDYDLFT